MKFTLILISTFVVLVIIEKSVSQDSPGFFLKVMNKNVPRLGKRNPSLDNYFRKVSKNVPRIGRRSNEPVDDSHMDELEAQWWQDDPRLPAQSKQHKRVVPMNSGDGTFGFYEYNVIQPIDSNTLLDLLAKDMLPNDNLKFITWKDFDRALQNDAELFGKMISLAHESLSQLKDDLSYKKFVPLFGNSGHDDFVFYQDGNNGQLITNADKQRMEYSVK